jgi:hypothetical protein
MRGVRGGGEMVGEREMMGEREGLWMGLACGMGSSWSKLNSLSSWSVARSRGLRYLRSYWHWAATRAKDEAVSGVAEGSQTNSNRSPSSPLRSSQPRTTSPSSLMSTRKCRSSSSRNVFSSLSEATPSSLSSCDPSSPTSSASPSSYTRWTTSWYWNSWPVRRIEAAASLKMSSE